MLAQEPGVREAVGLAVVALPLAVAAGLSPSTGARVLGIAADARPLAARGLAEVVHEPFEPRYEARPVREVQGALVGLGDLAQFGKGVDVQKRFEKGLVGIGLFGSHVSVVEDDAKEKVHAWGSAGFFCEQVRVVGLYLVKRRVVGRTNDFRVVLALVPELLVDSVVKVVQPAVGGLSVLEVARHEFDGAFTAEAAGENVLLGEKNSFFAGQVFGGD